MCLCAITVLFSLDDGNMSNADRDLSKLTLIYLTTRINDINEFACFFLAFKNSIHLRAFFYSESKSFFDLSVSFLWTKKLKKKSHHFLILKQLFI